MPISMPKKKYRAALQSALSAKVAEGKLFVVSDLSLEQPKTKLLAKALDAIQPQATHDFGHCRRRPVRLDAGRAKSADGQSRQRLIS